MTAARTATLPGRDDMLRRLRGVKVMDSRHTADGFYPLLLEYAGQELAAAGIAYMFQLAISDYAAEIPQARVTLTMALPYFVTALVDDEDVRRETLAILEQS